jgi:uncharacterized membrane protein
MIPLVALLLSFAAFWLLNKYVLKNKVTLSYIGRASLSIMLLLTSSAHFSKTAEMVQSMPDFLPCKIQLVYFTGIIEILAAIGLLVNKTAEITSLTLIVFFISILPANVVGSLKEVKLGGMENGPVYLFFRIPLQLFFIWWTYYFGIRKFIKKVTN